MGLYHCTHQGDVARLLADEGQGAVDHLLLDCHLQSQHKQGEQMCTKRLEGLIFDSREPVLCELKPILGNFNLYSYVIFSRRHVLEA